jgi:DNA-binding beta-propeller fold protein YncE
MRVRSRNDQSLILAVLMIATGVGVFWLPWIDPLQLAERDAWESAGSARLTAFEELPEMGDVCTMEPGLAEVNALAGLNQNDLFAAFQTRPVYAAAQAAQGTTTTVGTSPLRVFKDLDPGYTSVWVHHETDEVYLQDSNMWSIRVFNRSENTPPNAARSEPKRVIVGPKTGIEYNSEVYVDPKNGEIYSVQNDAGDQIIVLPPNASGDVAPIRTLNVPHRAYAISMDEEKQEMYVTIQAPPHVVVYRKTATGDEPPLRILQGESARLSDLRGVSVDKKRNQFVVANWGSVARVAGYDAPDKDYALGGRFDPPSISVYPLSANGDTAPMRVIQGPKTRLNWPGMMNVDPETGELFVASELEHAILVFGPNAEGDVAPIRMIKGPKTGMSYPLGLHVDAKNREVWVTNFGNSSATAYSLTANGDVAPLRTIRSAPVGKVSAKFGRSSPLVYDTKREEILVPN